MVYLLLTTLDSEGMEVMRNLDIMRHDRKSSLLAEMLENRQVGRTVFSYLNIFILPNALTIYAPVLCSTVANQWSVLVSVTPLKKEGCCDIKSVMIQSFSVFHLLWSLKNCSSLELLTLLRVDSTPCRTHSISTNTLDVYLSSYIYFTL